MLLGTTWRSYALEARLNLGDRPNRQMLFIDSELAVDSFLPFLANTGSPTGQTHQRPALSEGGARKSIRSSVIT